MTVPTLTKLNLRRVRDREIIDAFYMESCSLVGFMIKKYGSDKFTRFCRQLRDGESLDKALASTYSGTINSVDKLNTHWQKHIRK